MVERFKSGPSLRAWILDEDKDWTRREEIIDAFDRCVDALSDFRATHIRIASEYIVKEGKKRNEKAFTGTGGTPFMKYLTDHVSDTKAVRIRPPVKSGLGGLKLAKKKPSTEDTGIYILSLFSLCFLLSSLSLLTLPPLFICLSLFYSRFC